MIALSKETKFKQGGNIFVPLKTVVRESFAQYYSEVILEVPSPLSVSEPIQVGDALFYVRDIMKGDSGIQYVLMPLVWAKSTGVLSNPRLGPITANKLIGDFGTSVSGSTGATYMTLPASTLRKTMNYIKESSSTGGRGLFHTIDSSGHLKLICPQTVLAQKTGALDLAGSVMEHKYSIDWVHMTPGLVYLIFYTDEGIEEEILRITPTGHLIPVVHYYYSAFLHNEAEKESIRNRFRNTYWYNFYTSDSIKIKDTTLVSLGATVSYSGSNYIVWETETAFTGGSVDSSVIITRGPA